MYTKIFNRKRLIGYFALAFRELTPFKAATFVASALFLCSLYVIGPNVQNVIISLASSGKPAIYEASYGNGVIIFPSFQDWLKNREYWYYAIAALLTATIIWRQPTIRRIAFTAYLTTVLVLITIDVSLSVYNGSLFQSDIIYDVMFDSIGGIFMTGAIILQVRLMDLLLADAPQYGFGNGLLTIFCPILVGTLVVLGVYTAERLLYSPSHVSFDAFIAAPVHGVIIDDSSQVTHVSDREKERLGIFKKRQFSLIRDLSDYDLVTWLGDGLIKVQLIPTNERYAAYINFFSGCTENNLKSMPPLSKESIKLGNINSIKFNLDKGFTTFAVAKGNGNVSVEPNGVSQYSLDPALPTSLDVSEFVGDKATMRVGDAHSRLGFYLIANLFTTTKDDKVRLSDRTLTVVADGAARKFTFLGKGANLARGRKVVCHAIEVEDTENIDISSSDPTVVAYVRLIPVSNLIAVDADNLGSLMISGQDGWVNAKNVAFSSFENIFQNDRLNFVTFSGDVKSFIVDSAKINTSQYITYQLYGHDMHGSVNDNGIVELRGFAIAAWSGNTRLNPTWWESLDWKVKWGICSGLLVVLGVIGKLLWRVIVDDEVVRSLR